MYADGRTPPIANVLRWASRPSDDAELRRFVTQRLLVFARLMATIIGVLYVLGAAYVAIFAPSYFVTVHTHPGKLVNLGLFAVMLALWLVLRRSELSERSLRVLDLGAVLAMAVGVGIGISTAPAGYHLELAGLLLIVFVLVLRAAIVPSTGPWTAVIGTLSSVPVLLGAYRLALRAPPTEIVPTAVVMAGLTTWCVAATAASTVVSRVIYGLVTQVRAAMQLGSYTLGERIGEGGMGSVYRAEHAMLRRATAVKLLLPARVSAEALARFELEVQLTSRLSHPNTVAIYDYGRTPDGIFYYAMEYLDGLSLESLVNDDGPQTDGRVVRVLMQAAGALAEAHAVGLIHRDIKPANIMLCERGGMPDVVKVLDFGLVKKVDVADDQVALTSVQALVGTPLYMAPESIARPDEIGARIDIYALGGVGYFLLTGTAPFSGRTAVEVCGHHLHTPPDPPSARIGRTVPDKLEGLILRCLAKRPEQRPDAQELLTLLGECESAIPWTVVEARAWWSQRRRQPLSTSKNDVMDDRLGAA